MQPKMRKSGCALTLSTSPFSDSSRLRCAVSSFSSSATLSSVSGAAKFISSSSTQSPLRTACTSEPSTNLNTSDLSAELACFSNSRTRSYSARHSAIRAALSVSLSLRFFASSSSCFANSVSAILNASRHSRTTPFHCALLNIFASSFRNCSFFFTENDRRNSSSKSSCSGIARLLVVTGLNPPSRSPTSVCCDTLITVSFLLSSRAISWTIVVLPVPVSPTSSSGSHNATPTPIFSISRRQWLVRANAVLLRAGFSPRAVFLRRCARPTDTASGYSSNDGTCLFRCTVARDVGTSKHTATAWTTASIGLRSTIELVKQSTVSWKIRSNTSSGSRLALSTCRSSRIRVHRLHSFIRSRIVRALGCAPLFMLKNLRESYSSLTLWKHLMNMAVKFASSGNLVSRIVRSSFVSSSSSSTTFHSRKPIMSCKVILRKSPATRSDEINWNPFAALITSPRDGMVSSLFSSRLSKIDKTSFGALSMSSTSTQRPSLTAVVKTPFFHSKVPGLAPDEYVPRSSFESVCWFRWIFTIVSSCNILATSLIRNVLPVPERPTSSTGSDLCMHCASWFIEARDLGSGTNSDLATSSVLPRIKPQMLGITTSATIVAPAEKSCCTNLTVYLFSARAGFKLGYFSISASLWASYKATNS
ncbi:hypothetical protein OGATHE_001233 [Ogataea polymorpha]|uniref:Uncharacterized protein n=1 Tax=Ogataea polymorpha TaxID=460523 RepID=A0A9P8TEM0_9ASCO|nr:hypothetical protein OGATHE_001233 [Ogataea polymorpha]